MRGLNIQRPNQVWCADISYIPILGGYMYLFVIMDWYSRKVTAWSLSTTLDAHFCISYLERAISLYGSPEIFNIDQGCQFTREGFTGVLEKNSSHQYGRPGEILRQYFYRASLAVLKVRAYIYSGICFGPRTQKRVKELV